MSLEEENKRLMEENESLKNQLKGLQDTMTLYTTSLSLFITPITNLVNNRRLLAEKEGVAPLLPEDIKSTALVVAETSLENPDYTEEEVSFLKAFVTFLDGAC